MIVELVIFLSILYLWWALKDARKHKGCPPGPRRFPFVGNMPQLFMAASSSPYPSIQLLNVTKQYGDLVTIQLGQLPTVVASTCRTISELLSHPNTNISRGGDKMPSIWEKYMQKNIGVIWSSGDVWETHRRFTIRTLRDFGFGKSTSMDFAINEEFEKFEKDLNKQISASPKGIVKFEDSFDLTVISILWRLATGVSYPTGDPKMVQLLKYSKELMRATNLGNDITMAFPFLHKFMGKDKEIKLRDALHNYFRNTISEFRKKDLYTDPRCLIDVYLERIDKAQSKGGDELEKTFTDEMLMVILFDLLQAGADTSSNSLNFAMLYMILYPEVQRKVQEEIDSVVPKGEEMTMSYKSKLPYCTATIMEVQRCAVIVPSLTRDVTEDIQMDGYTIPKGTIIITNLEAMRMDKDVWGDPENFRPERFLTKDGKGVDQKMVDNVLMFGAGKRMCLGYQLAEASYFLYFTSMMRSYEILKAVGEPEPTVERAGGITYNALPFYAKVISRK